jgi:hypothetical protein
MRSLLFQIAQDCGGEVSRVLTGFLPCLVSHASRVVRLMQSEALSILLASDMAGIAFNVKNLHPRCASRSRMLGLLSYVFNLFLRFRQILVRNPGCFVAQKDAFHLFQVPIKITSVLKHPFLDRCFGEAFRDFIRNVETCQCNILSTHSLHFNSTLRGCHDSIDYLLRRFEGIIA